MAQPTPTPSSEIIHLVSTFADTLDSLPPSLTRSLSDLKELDAVLSGELPNRVHCVRSSLLTSLFRLNCSGSLQSITDKLKLLADMMYTPPPDSTDAHTQPKYTPLERLKLLREVTEDARTFQVGGEDKIRVATNTCESVSDVSRLGILRGGEADQIRLRDDRFLPQLLTSLLSLPSSSLSFLVTSSLSYQLLQLLTATQLPRLPLLPSLDANSSITLLLDMQLNSRPLNGQQLEMRTTLLEVDPVQRTARNEQLQTLTME